MMTVMTIASVSAVTFMVYAFGKIRAYDKMDKASSDFWKEVEKDGV